MGAEGIGHGAGDAQRVAPGVVGVGNYGGPGAVQDGDDITLQVGDVVVGGAVVGHRHGGRRVVGKVQRVASNGHLTEGASVVDVAVCCSTVASGSPYPIGIVSIGPGGSPIGHGGQLPAMLPGIGPGAVGEHIADGIAGYGAAVVPGEQVAPFGIPVGVADSLHRGTEGAVRIGVLGAGGDVAAVVVGPHPGLARGLVVLPDELVGGIVGVGSGVGAVGDIEDVAVGVVGVGIGNIIFRGGGAQGAYEAGGPASAGFCYAPKGRRSPAETLFFRRVTCRKRKWRCYVPASIAFWGQKIVQSP